VRGHAHRVSRPSAQVRALGHDEAARADRKPDLAVGEVQQRQDLGAVRKGPTVSYPCVSATCWPVSGNQAGLSADCTACMWRPTRRPILLACILTGPGTG
jgi:hypothetical protein